MNGYRLVRHPPAPGPAGPPVLDEAQQRVVDHKGGPLLVLAGPGTGKTTTIVAAVADRIERRGIEPGRILVLTFSRKAAGELRDRITARLGRTTSEPLALTFHSYAYALVRREFVLAGDQPPRLLSAPEQLLEIRRLLRGEVADGAGDWPPRLWPALATRGFAEELRDVLMRAAERGLDGKGLRQLGRRNGRDDWVAAGAFLDRYAARFDLAPVPAYDYAEIISIAAGLLTREATRQRERDAYDAVFVDEYQDCDPAQEALLRALAGDGRDLVAVGDPDQSIYAFRGADVRAVTRFPDTFRGPDASPAPVVALRTCRRSGPVLLSASRRLARRLPAAPGEQTAAHRDLTSVRGVPPGLIRIRVADTQAQEAAVVADTLRRAHLADDVPWSRMAVLVRSARRQIPALRRALAAAGVPVTVAGDDLPLPDEPGVRPLLTLLRCALEPRRLTEETAVELLTGPLGQTDALGVRKLRRALAGASPREAIIDPRLLVAISDRVAAPARRIAALLEVAVARIAAGGTAEDVLWAVWDASGLADQWERQAERDPAADRDLDAVLALFDAAARFTDDLPPGSLRLFLDSLSGQEIAGDTLAERAVREDCVRLLTAHRAKGLEWDVVVVAGVQEETWPDLRLRGSLLGADEVAEAMAATGTGTGTAAGARTAEARGMARDVAAATLAARLLAEERRLFYVAVTRARRLLVVTASGGDEQDQRPSRFLAELAGDDIEIERASATRWLSLPALVADLRRTAADASQSRPFRAAAARQLARLADAGVRGADPRGWYALTELSDSAPVVSAGERVRLSPSHVETFTRCGLRWLLESAVGAGRPDVLRHLGTVIHAAAQLIAEGATEQAVAARIDDIWHHLDFGSVWYGSRQREVAEHMVRKFLDWHLANPRELLATEQALRVRVGRVEITGRVDRLERDGLGRGVIVDLKTGGTAPREDELDRHPQLGVYQLAVLLGAFERLGVTDPGGAELVQVGKAGLTARARVQHQHALAEDSDPGWARELVDAVAAGMAGPVYQARANPGCRTCPVASCCPVQPDGIQVSQERQLGHGVTVTDAPLNGTLTVREVPSVDYATSRAPASTDSRHAWAEPGLEALGDGLYRIPLPLPGDSLTAVNVYAITGPDGIDLIDAGMALEQARDRLAAALAELGYGLPDIRNFFITHIHQDHYTLAVELRPSLRGLITLGEEERINMAAIRDVAQGRNEPGFIEMLPALGAAELADQVRAIMSPRLADPKPRLKWDDPDCWLTDGAEIKLPSRTLRAIHTPGHTRGHVVFHDPAAAVLFAGDHVLPHITPSIGFQPAITRQALNQYLGSLELMLTLPDSRLLPAHGPVRDSTHARVNELLEHHETRLAQTLEVASGGPVTAYQVAHGLPWTRRLRKLTELDTMNRLLAVGETAAHLEVLVARGQLVRAAAPDGIDYYAIPATDR